MRRSYSQELHKRPRYEDEENRTSRSHSVLPKRQCDPQQLPISPRHRLFPAMLPASYVDSEVRALVIIDARVFLSIVESVSNVAAGMQNSSIHMLPGDKPHLIPTSFFVLTLLRQKILQEKLDSRYIRFLIMLPDSGNEISRIVSPWHGGSIKFEVFHRALLTYFPDFFYGDFFVCSSPYEVLKQRFPKLEEEGCCFISTDSADEGKVRKAMPRASFHSVPEYGSFAGDHEKIFQDLSLLSDSEKRLVVYLDLDNCAFLRIPTLLKKQLILNPNVVEFLKSAIALYGKQIAIRPITSRVGSSAQLDPSIFMSAASVIKSLEAELEVKCEKIIFTDFSNAKMRKIAFMVPQIKKDDVVLFMDDDYNENDAVFRSRSLIKQKEAFVFTLPVNASDQLQPEMLDSFFEFIKQLGFTGFQQVNADSKENVEFWNTRRDEDVPKVEDQESTPLSVYNC